jgi:hypothetical protein
MWLNCLVSKCSFSIKSFLHDQMTGILRPYVRADDYDDRMTTTVMAGRMAR